MNRLFCMSYAIQFFVDNFFERVPSLQIGIVQRAWFDQSSIFITSISIQFIINVIVKQNTDVTSNIFMRMCFCTFNIHNKKNHIFLIYHLHKTFYNFHFFDSYFLNIHSFSLIFERVRINRGRRTPVWCGGGSDGSNDGRPAS